jgi:hypothetical protein
MTSPRRPAGYAPGTGAATRARRRTLARTAAQRGWPAPTIYADDDAQPGGGHGRALARLEAAIAAGRHDALLMPAPADPTPLMSLLQRCTKHGVAVSFLLAAHEADLKPAAAGTGSARPGSRASWGVLTRARLEALASLYPGWRIWLDQHGWHARRRDGYVQDYRPGAPSFSVHADTATGLAAQLCWQRAAEAHAPHGCEREPDRVRAT